MNDQIDRKEDEELTELVGQDATTQLLNALACGEGKGIDFEQKEAHVKAIISEYYNNARGARFCSIMKHCAATMVRYNYYNLIFIN